MEQHTMSAPSQENPEGPRLRELWRTRKISFLIGAAVVLLLGLYAALVAVPNVYEAQTVLTVRSGDTGATALLTRNFASEITSNTVLVPVVEGIGKTPAGTSPSERQAAVDALRESLQIVNVHSVSGGETEIRISSRGASGKELAALVNLTAGTYVADCQKRTKAQSDSVEKLRQEAALLSGNFQKTAEQKTSAEEALKTFETEHADVLGEVGGDPDAVLKGFMEQQKTDTQTLDKTQAEIEELKTAADLLRTRLKDVPQFIETKEVTTVPDPERAALEHEVRMMERQLEEMLRNFTFKHPEVIELTKKIDAKRQQLEKLQGRVEDTVKQSKKDNPEYALLKGKLDDAEVKQQVERGSVSRLSLRQEGLAKRIASLQGLIGSYRKLKDNLAQAQKQYAEQETALRDRNNQLAAASKTVEPVPEIGRPAGVPTDPVGPRRSLYFLAALILAMLGGRLSMSAAYRLSHGFASEYELKQITGMSVAGSISAMEGTEAARHELLRKRIRLVALVGLAALVIAAVAVILGNSA
jgi:capsular polysaccharide biosynthesis protein